MSFAKSCDTKSPELEVEESMKVFQIRTLIFILMAIDISITYASIEREVAWILTLSDAEKRI